MRENNRNEVIDDNLTPEQKKQALQEAHARRERLIDNGKVIVYTIAIINIVDSVVSLIVGSAGIIALIFNIVISVALMSGKGWARVLFVIGLSIGILLSLIVLSTPSIYMPTGVMVFLAIALIYGVVVIVLLFTSKAVSEFMYWAKNG
ncbi:MAG: hypothetical protein FWC32_03480 [Firmicutes bacterium]|nr:hypothetical protein [Bacillota bacterium]